MPHVTSEGVYHQLLGLAGFSAVMCVCGVIDPQYFLYIILYLFLFYIKYHLIITIHFFFLFSREILHLVQLIV